MAKILITSALPYVNDVPHLGNLIGSTLSADVYAKHARLEGHDVLYVCGSDEHGTTTEKKAREEGLTPQELCDKYHAIHTQVYDWFGIAFDIYGRTHTKVQEEIVHEIFLALVENGYVSEHDVEQLYDEQAEQFLADRFVEGTCPFCDYEKARGDQCDNCQKLINAPELREPKSTLTGTTPIIKKSTHLFLDLPKLKDKIADWAKENDDGWSENAKRVTQTWLADLKERAITRDLNWGISIPKEGYENKVFYVWFDAPIGYISMTAHEREDWKEWWHNDEVQYAQFMGKDNIVFHSIIFPGMLLGTGNKWTMVDQLSVTEYLNNEKGKFSKSLGTGVFGTDCIELEKEHGIPPDYWRYYLVSQRPETSDTVFGWKDFQEKINNELIANYGNLVHRTLHFAATKLDDVESATADSGEIEKVLVHIDAARKHFDGQHFRAALKELMAASKEANTYFQHSAPWEKLDDKQEAADIIHTLLTLIRNLSVALQPVIPHATGKVLDMLHVEDRSYEVLDAELGSDIFSKLQKPHVLFKKLEDDLVAQLEERFTNPTHDLNLRVAKVKEAKQHLNADKLYVITLDVGDHERTIVSGLVPYYSAEELAGKHIVVVCNLEPAKIRGETSNGMLLAGEQDDVVGLLTAPDAEPGTQLTIGGKPGGDSPLAFSRFQKFNIHASKEAVTVDEGRVEGASFVLEKDVYGPLR